MFSVFGQLIKISIKVAKLSLRDTLKIAYVLTNKAKNLELWLRANQKVSATWLPG